MTSTTRKFQTILATAVLAMSTLLITPTANAEPAIARAEGNSCRYDRYYKSNSTHLLNDGCKQVRAGSQYRTHSGSIAYAYGFWHHNESWDTPLTNLTRVNGVADIKVPWRNLSREVRYIFR
jgi:hypothetical protein